jgi:hypothetical protein
VTGTGATAAGGTHEPAGDAPSVAVLRAESARLLAEHQALRAEIEPRAAARELGMREAFDSQRAAHEAETRAWNGWSEVRDARRADPRDLGLVAAADQAEAAYEEARRAAKIAAREAAAIARRARDESARDTARLSGLGAKCRAAQDRYRAATRALSAPPQAAP